MHQPVQNGGGHGGVSEVFAPVLHYTVGSDDDGAAQLVALVHDGLQQLCTHIGDAPGQKQIVKEATEIVAKISGDASLPARTWVLLTEAVEGGWGMFGTAFGKEEFAGLAAKAKAAAAG